MTFVCCSWVLFSLTKETFSEMHFLLLQLQPSLFCQNCLASHPHSVCPRISQWNSGNAQYDFETKNVKTHKFVFKRCMYESYSSGCWNIWCGNLSNTMHSMWWKWAWYFYLMIMTMPMTMEHVPGNLSKISFWHHFFNGTVFFFSRQGQLLYNWFEETRGWWRKTLDE